MTSPDDPGRTGEGPRRGVAREGRRRTADPRRHRTMTADNTTPAQGHESTDFETDGYPLTDASAERLADVLEDEKAQTVATIDELVRALRDGDVDVTGDRVERLFEATDRLAALSRSLSLRVVDDPYSEE